MKHRKFLQSLREMKRAGFRPYLRNVRAIRILSPDGELDFCPVSGVCFWETKELFGSSSMEETLKAGRKIGLSDDQIHVYGRAADFAYQHEHREKPFHRVRRSLLKVLALKD
jgi:hypothetical protein